MLFTPSLLIAVFVEKSQGYQHLKGILSFVLQSLNDDEPTARYRFDSKIKTRCSCYMTVVLLPFDNTDISAAVPANYRIQNTHSHPHQSAMINSFNVMIITSRSTRQTLRITI